VAEAFTGFPPSGIAFLAGLAADNTRAYFDRNRSTYAHDVAAPLQTLVIAVGQRLRDGTGQDLCFDPTVGKSLFRINRDTRFSADKTPYHPWVDAIWWAGLHDARRASAFIFRLSAGGLVAGVGITGLRDTHLDRYRTAVADDPSGRPLHDLLNQLSVTLPRRGDHRAGPQARTRSLPARPPSPRPPALRQPPRFSPASQPPTLA
jgi:uncharacterized protein (TIGR02453 family)